MLIRRNWGKAASGIYIKHFECGFEILARGIEEKEEKMRKFWEVEIYNGEIERSI